MGKVDEMKRRTKEEIEADKILKEVERQRKKEEREAKRLAKEEEKARKAELNKKTEKELVHQYANTIMAKQRTRGMVKEKFKDMRGDKPNKDLWMDFDFFFSVVFQSREQKVQFLEFLAKQNNIEPDKFFDSTVTQIINGLELARAIGCPLKKEIANEFPLGNIELKDLVLDDEKV
jgi:transposase